MPGQIDLHAHIGNNSGLHDYVHSLNPGFRVWDFIDPESSLVKDSIASGITTILTIPGSGGNNSGFGVLWKLGGAKREDLIIRKLGAIKIAQAYNPERRVGDLGLSRMGMWWMLREQFERARRYSAQWQPSEQAGKRAGEQPYVQLASLNAPAAKSKAVAQPKRVLGLEQMRNVIEHKTPVFVHTAGARDVMATMRMFHDEMGLPLILSHGEFGGRLAAARFSGDGLIDSSTALSRGA